MIRFASAVGAIGAVIAAVALAGCGGQTKPAGEASVRSASSPASSPAAAPATGDKPSREFVVGKWGTDGDCTLAMELRPDGSSDGPFGNWSYSDGVISFADAPELKVNVTIIDDKTMASKNSDGKITRMTRCP